MVPSLASIKLRYLWTATQFALSAAAPSQVDHQRPTLACSSIAAYKAVMVLASKLLFPCSSRNLMIAAACLIHGVRCGGAAGTRSRRGVLHQLAAHCPMAASSLSLVEV